MTSGKRPESNTEASYTWTSWLVSAAKGGAISITKTALVTHTGTLAYSAADVAFSHAGYHPYDHEAGMNFSVAAGSAYLGLEMAAALIRLWQSSPVYTRHPAVAQGVVDVALMTLLGMAGYMTGQAITGTATILSDLSKYLIVFIVTFGSGRIYGAYRPPVSAGNILGGAVTEIIGLWSSAPASELPQGTTLRELIDTVTGFTAMLVAGTLWDLARATLSRDRVQRDSMSEALLGESTNDDGQLSTKPPRTSGPFAPQPPAINSGFELITSLN